MPSSMSLLPPQWRPFRFSTHLHGCRLQNTSRIYASITTETRQPNLRVVEPQIPSPVVDPTLLLSTQLAGNTRKYTGPDSSLQSTWAHRAWVASGCSSVLLSLAKSVASAWASHMWLEPLLAGLVGYILADLGTGIYHWGIDNYGDASTPVFGSQIEAFQGHHKWPWTITRREFANNLHALARMTTFVVLPMDLAIDDPVIHAFVAVCSGCIMFSQQFHAWAHGTKSRLPPIVVALQDAGVLVSRAGHSAHHRQPYNNNYCIVSGVWNVFLDKQGFFEAMEMVLFFRFGVRPRSWSEPNSDWTEEAEASPS